MPLTKLTSTPFIRVLLKSKLTVINMLPGLQRIRCLAPAVQNLRLFCVQAKKEIPIDKALLSKLRKKTGYPLMNCKQALAQFDNDIKQAEAWMREEAQKAGWAKAGKLQGRPMSQGLVGLLEDESSVTVVEVNCETDFVAKNENFQVLVSQVTEACRKSMTQNSGQKVMIEKDQLSDIPAGEKTVADIVALLVGKLGENIAVRRATQISKEPSSVLSTFVHASGPPLVKDNCQMGKFAAVVKVEIPDTVEVARQLCQHVVGMNPVQIGEWQPQNVDKKEQKKKKKKEENSESKREEIEENRLLDQEFLLDSTFTVRRYLQDNGPKVLDFVRIECGEDLGEDD